jgi:DNA polymerase IIIc chi subunit
MCDRKLWRRSPTSFLPHAAWGRIKEGVMHHGKSKKHMREKA